MPSDRNAALVASLLAGTTRLQNEAADPTASVWVSANAGTGKTHVLTQRVLRILLTGTQPERILCLTYTKAAAAEMSKRVFDTLAGWVGLSDLELNAALAKLLGTPPATRERDLARTLFTRAIETPGGFKVQTIHAFCEQLLQRFPLEAGVAPGFKILDDQLARTLIREAIDETLTEAVSDRHSLLGQALTTTIRYAADDQFDEVLTAAIRQRALLDGLLRRPSDGDGDGDPFTFAGQHLRAALNVGKAAERTGIRDQMEAVLDAPSLARLRAALAEGTKTDVERAKLIGDIANLTGSSRIAALSSLFLTQTRTPRASLMTASVRKAHPDLEMKIEQAQSRFVELDRELSGLEVVAATLALYRLADAVLTRYQSAKAARAALDFEDLIVKSANLLGKDTAAAWVLFKLDGGLDHILVDEAQDTAPSQWQVVQRIAGEFFSDAGAGGKTGPRTVFAVGDEKQSIYSFQGARPELFAKTGVEFKAHAGRIGMTWHDTELTLSFRTVAPVLAAVDRVFADPLVTPGLATDTTKPITHAVKRIGQSGLVEIWPTERAAEKTENDAWTPLEETTRTSPVAKLAGRIATTIRGWIDTGEMLHSQGRPIRAGDILILVRKREPFASAIVSALKDQRVPVAGADRIVLANQIAVQDLLALGDFLTLPEDDLSLAAILKSPLFGLDDDHLLALASGRKGMLWKALLDAAAANPVYERAAGQLKRWRKEADFKPPFEFYASVLDHDGGRLKMLERLGPEAADSIDEFLNLALSYDDQAPPSLTGFLGWLRDGDRQIKRDMEQGRNEVRVLTIHGSKGLEAPVVFLPDTTSTKTARSSGLLTLTHANSPSGIPQLAVWPVKGSANLTPIKDAKDAIKRDETRELNRLLYVALTRPRDRLYIAGFQSRDKLPTGCWYETITSALASCTTPVTLPCGSTVRRLVADQTAPAEPAKDHIAHDVTAAPRPAWMDAPAPREAQPAIPVAPSRLAPYDFDDAGEPTSHPFPDQTPASVPTSVPRPAAPAREPAAASPLCRDGHRFLRGTLTHALLEHLPSLPRDGWQRAAIAFLDRRASGLSKAARASIAAETLAVLNDTTFAALFGASSEAEVPIVAELANPSGKGPSLKLNGQIDRLVETDDAVLIVDYKTNRPPPMDVSQVAETYLVQLAAYKLALAQVFPGKPIRAALLWTQTPSLMEIPSATLDLYSSRLWEFGTPRVDVTGLPS